MPAAYDELVVRRDVHRGGEGFSEVDECGVTVLSATHADVAEYLRMRLVEGHSHMEWAQIMNDRDRSGDKVSRRRAEMEILP